MWGLLYEAVHLQPFHLHRCSIVIAEENVDGIVAQFFGVAGFASETANDFICHPFGDGLGGEVVKTGHAVVGIGVTGITIEPGLSVDIHVGTFDDWCVWMRPEYPGKTATHNRLHEMIGDDSVVIFRIDWCSLSESLFECGGGIDHQTIVGHRAPVQADAIGINAIQYFFDILGGSQLQVLVEVEESNPLIIVAIARIAISVGMALVMLTVSPVDDLYLFLLDVGLQHLVETFLTVVVIVVYDDFVEA